MLHENFVGRNERRDLDSSLELPDDRSYQLKEKNMSFEKKQNFLLKRPVVAVSVALLLAFATGVQAQITLVKDVAVTDIVAGQPISASTVGTNFSNLHDNDTDINAQLTKLNSAQWTYSSGGLSTLLYKGGCFQIVNSSTSTTPLPDPFFSVDQKSSKITAVISNKINKPRGLDTDPDLSMALKIIGGCDTAAGGAVVSIHRPNGTQIGAIIQEKTIDYVSYATSSDRRLKDNIVDTRYSLDQLLKIQVRDYTFKSDPAKTLQTGFIAQELYEVYPDAVCKPGNEEGTWLVDYGRLSPILVKSIQDQQKEIDALKQENAELKARIAAIEKKLGM
jgi:cell division protein FtsB